VPLAVAISPANLNDCEMLRTMIDLVPSVRGRRGRPRRRPRKLHADKGYDHAFCRITCRLRNITPRIARRGVESHQKLGRYRWVVERSIAWLHLFRRLAVRHERRADVHQAFLTIGAALICFNFAVG
jgi:IS5 family transposase